MPILFIGKRCKRAVRHFIRQNREKTPDMQVHIHTTTWPDYDRNELERSSHNTSNETIIYNTNDYGALWKTPSVQYLLWNGRCCRRTVYVAVDTAYSLLSPVFHRYCRGIYDYIVIGSGVNETELKIFYDAYDAHFKWANVTFKQFVSGYKRCIGCNKRSAKYMVMDIRGFDPNIPFYKLNTHSGKRRVKFICCQRLGGGSTPSE
jgi:hypothetical protein